MKQGGAQMVKLEGGAEQVETVRRLSAAGVPVCEGYYRMSEQWPEESIRRFKAARDAT